LHKTVAESFYPLQYVAELPYIRQSVIHRSCMTSSNVQSNTTCFTNIGIDLGLHVSIHYGIIIRPSLKYSDPYIKLLKHGLGSRPFTTTFVYGTRILVNIVRPVYMSLYHKIFKT